MRPGIADAAARAQPLDDYVVLIDFSHAKWSATPAKAAKYFARDFEQLDDIFRDLFRLAVSMHSFLPVCLVR
jgi:hypothetical protein